MIDTASFGTELKKLGFRFYSGVPCSYLKNLINYTINECIYVPAANEGDAVAIASGAFLGGERPVVLMQNSGLTNAVSPLVSLNFPFRIPLLGFVSLRGEPGVPDEPQHELMGRMTTELLTIMEVAWAYLSCDLTEAKLQLEHADQVIADNRPFFFIVKKGTFTEETLLEQHLSVTRYQVKKIQSESDQKPPRVDALRIINAGKDSKTVQLATTGKTGRELYEIEDTAGNLYMVGSMGCVSSLGLGLALSQKDRNVVVIDGDGSTLMRMGSLATNGYCGPANMLHILLDNNAHDSTGGQNTVSHNVNFVEIASACGYMKSFYIHNLNELEDSIRDWKNSGGLSFLYMKISRSSGGELGRPNIKPVQVKERLRTFLGTGSPVLGEEK